jgi:predicted ester cyclase
MNKIEIVKMAFDLDNPDGLSLWSEDFQRTDAMGSPPMDWDSWQAMNGLMRSAFPDLGLVIEDIREEGDDVVVTTRFTGTFINALDLSAMGMGVVPATGKAVHFPTGTDRVSFDKGKIVKMHGLDTGSDGGFAGFFKAIGLETS